MGGCNCDKCTLCPECIKSKISILNDVIYDLSEELPRHGEIQNSVTAIHVTTILRCICAKEMLKQCNNTPFLGGVLVSYSDFSQVSLLEYWCLSQQIPELRDTYLFRELGVRWAEFDTWTVKGLLDGIQPDYSNVEAAIKFVDECM